MIRLVRTMRSDFEAEMMRVSQGPLPAERRHSHPAVLKLGSYGTSLLENASRFLKLRPLATLPPVAPSNLSTHERHHYRQTGEYPGGITGLVVFMESGDLK